MEARYMFRPVVKASAVAEGVETPLGDWVHNWKEAQAVLFERGLAGYNYGIFVMHPAVTIIHEVYYR